jgi:thiol-disulfide isomerase/thioredoxin
MRNLLSSFRCLAALPALVLLSSQTQAAHAAQIAIGQPAPALTFTTLLQAPPGTRADWSALRGKVVVLEFWATWCGGCIVEIPHLNDLEKSLAATPEGANIQFIAVDDEDPAVVKKFIARIPIGGWLGIDTSKKIIAAYGAKSRPLTVVVDPRGRIAAIFGPEQLEADQLQALADGKLVKFPSNTMAGIREEALKQAEAAKSAENGTGGVRPIFDLAIRPGDPNGGS